MKKTIAILFVVLMVLTVLSSAGIGAAAPVSSSGRDIVLHKSPMKVRTKPQKCCYRVCHWGSHWKLVCSQVCVPLGKPGFYPPYCGKTVWQ